MTFKDFDTRGRDLEANKKGHQYWEKYWEPVPTEKPGMFQSWGAAVLAIGKVLGSIVAVALIVTAFVLAIAHQPVEAVLAGAGCLMFAAVFFRLGRKEKDTFWKIIGISAAGWLTIMAALAWGFVG